MASHKRYIMKTKKISNPIIYKKIKGETLSPQVDHYETAPLSSSCINTNLSSKNQFPFDISSKQGKFAWTKINEEYIPCILRDNEKFCSVQMIEAGILAKHFSRLNSGLFSFKKLISYHPTFNEIDLMKHINEEHCDRRYCKEYYGGNDYIVKVEDALELIKFLNFCNEKFENPHGHITPNSPCGFIRLDNESIITYTSKNGEKYVPIFYFDNLSHNFKNKIILSHEDWAISYLKFCCLIQGIENEIFKEHNFIEVIKLDELKLILPAKTKYEELWLHSPSIYNLFTKH